MMPESTTRDLARLLDELTGRARQRGWNDRQWALHAGLPQETLCRLRQRSRTSDHCDFATLLALATATDAGLSLRDASGTASTDGLWPARVDRELERALLDAFAVAVPDAARCRELAPPFFMAGLAVMLASVAGFDRPKLLALAETLHPGATELCVFERWLAGTPLRPDRFLPPLLAHRGAATRGGRHAA